SYRLNWTITSIAILIIAAIVFINHRFSDQVLMEKIEEGAIHQSNQVVSKIARITIGTEDITRNIANQAFYFYQHNELDFFLKQILASNEILESIEVYMLDDLQKDVRKFSSGNLDELICIPYQEIDDSYIQNLKEGKLVPGYGKWSDPIYCKNDTSHLFVSYYRPIYHPGTTKVAGLVSSVVSLMKIRQMLSEIKIEKKGYSFITNKSGWIITHPNEKWILKKNIFDNTSPIKTDYQPEIESKIRNSGRGVGNGVSEYLNGQKCWFYHATISNSDWILIIVIPEKELFRDHDRNLYKILGVSVLGILILFMMNMLIFKRILDPLVRVTNAIHGFASSTGKLDNTKDEIKMLAQSLEDWQIKYGKMVGEQLKTAKEKQKFEDDLKSAHEIQQNIIPTGYPAFADYLEIDLYAILKPAESIGGDLYDYYFIDEEHLLIAIGDVSGKGIPASLFMAIASTLIKSNSNNLSSREIIEKVNNELSDRNPNQYFVTLFIGILNVNTGIMDYCNAAHNYPFILHVDGTMRTLSKSHGIPLGIYKNKTYKSNTIELQQGDLILLYTDGIINSRNPQGTHFGTEKLKEEIQGMNNLDAKEVVTKLLKSIQNYEGGSAQSDDISLLALRYLYKTKNQA
ncbi:MAG: SpoIIE family protein phosphatase, partial [Verrucomicrobia bacterium]|nr:SpoIIE family protein phosphatase [Prolixibacteraceae bacterium]